MVGLALFISGTCLVASIVSHRAVRKLATENRMLRLVVAALAKDDDTAEFFGADPVDLEIARRAADQARWN
jgi:outer membrane murein-binding lipoprotein Lpp